MDLSRMTTQREIDPASFVGTESLTHDEIIFSLNFEKHEGSSNNCKISFGDGVLDALIETVGDLNLRGEDGYFAITYFNNGWGALVSMGVMATSSSVRNQLFQLDVLRGGKRKGCPELSGKATIPNLTAGELNDALNTLAAAKVSKD